MTLQHKGKMLCCSYFRSFIKSAIFSRTGNFIKKFNFVSTPWEIKITPGDNVGDSLPPSLPPTPTPTTPPPHNTTPPPPTPPPQHTLNHPQTPSHYHNHPPPHQPPTHPHQHMTPTPTHSMNPPTTHPQRQSGQECLIFHGLHIVYPFGRQKCF